MGFVWLDTWLLCFRVRDYFGVGLLVWAGDVGCGLFWIGSLIVVGLVVSLLFCRGGRFTFGF